MRKIGVLNSYSFPRYPGRQTRRIQGFLEGLAFGGWLEGRDFELRLADSESQAEAQDWARRFVDEGVDLIHGFGTGNTLPAIQATTEIPIVYYGSHPEGLGLEACAARNVTGEELHIPFTSSYKKFRFLRRLLPRVRVVWVPFYERTMFVSEELRGLYREAYEDAGRPVWFSGDAPQLCFRSIAGLCYIAGVEYRETVYSDTAELVRALEEVDPRDGVLMPYNEPFTSPGAPDAILRFCLERDVPIVWNNNPQVAALGGLCGIGADFAAMGREAGRRAAAILDGMKPWELPRGHHTGQIAWINLDTARRLELDPGPEVLACFDRHLTGRSDETYM
jgi:ABC-type uncharacterized transport system substrate-binding protein